MEGNVLWGGILKVVPLRKEAKGFYKSIYYSVGIEFDFELKLSLGFLFLVVVWGGGFHFMPFT